ncbi:MAG: hypothetical protein Q7K26_06845 [bacterium]|nr:hypothetical protein [bacterium]
MEIFPAVIVMPTINVQQDHVSETLVPVIGQIKPVAIRVVLLQLVIQVELIVFVVPVIAGKNVEDQWLVMLLPVHHPHQLVPPIGNVGMSVDVTLQVADKAVK